MKISVKSTSEQQKDHGPAPAFRNRLHRMRLSKRRARLLVSVIVFGAVAAWFVFATMQERSRTQAIDHGAYQVVYLTNGQAYFGKLQNTTGEYLVMRQPYTAQAVDNGGTKDPEQTPTTALLRVRDQVYGPEDSIAIRAETVAFWQNLRSDSKITAAIKAKQ